MNSRDRQAKRKCRSGGVSCANSGPRGTRLCLCWASPNTGGGAERSRRLETRRFVDPLVPLKINSFVTPMKWVPFQSPSILKPRREFVLLK